MLNKLAKMIEVAAIMGLNGLDLCGNRIDVFYEGGPTLVAERIDGKKLPEELSDPSHVSWDEYDPYVNFVGIRLNLPQDLIDDCEDDYWKIKDKSLIQELEEIVSTEENFHTWCNKQEKIEKCDSFAVRNIRLTYAYMLKKINKQNYFIPGDFCKKIKLYNILYGIRRKNIICGCFFDPNSSREIYLDYLEWAIDEML